MLGKTIRVDATSLTGLRSKFARICVEIDLAAPLIPSLTVLDFAQSVEYDGLHLICFTCGKYCHRGEECGTPKADAVPEPTPASSSTPSSPYGPWMLPSYVRRQQEQGQRHRPARHSPRAPPMESHDPGPSRPQRGPLDGSAHMSAGPARPSGGPAHITRSHFEVLQEPGQHDDLGVDIAQLKQQIRALQGTGISGSGSGPHRTRPKKKGGTPTTAQAGLQQSNPPDSNSVPRIGSTRPPRQPGRTRQPTPHGSVLQPVLHSTIVTRPHDMEVDPTAPSTSTSALVDKGKAILMEVQSASPSNIL